LNAQQVIEQLIALEERRGAALVERNRTQLEALFSSDLVHIHSTGIQMNKSELIDYVMNVLEFLTVTRSELVVKVHGDVAIMTGRMRNTMRRADKPETVTADALVTQVWLFAHGSWRQSHFHACRAA
jgi:nitrate reductase assembly molybdenum cofactor insertion protein NarJ